jgi:hypothetical protein
MYLSRLKISKPQTNPKAIAVNGLLNTVYNAYDDAIIAKIPVKKTVAPMPVYLLYSVGDCSRRFLFTPEQKMKKFPSVVISKDLSAKIYYYFL